MTITLDDASENIRHYGSKRAEVQSAWQLVESDAGERFVVELEGCESVIASVAGSSDAKFGSTRLPGEVGISVGADNGIILEVVKLSGEDGGLATLHLEYRARNSRERESDVKAGLQSRDIGAQWVERQELLEHYMARLPSRQDGKFNAALFQAWLSEEDPSARMDYSVTGEGGEKVSLGGGGGDGGGGGGNRGSTLTLAAAQRYAMGVQYAARQMLQVVVRETWRVPPDIDAKCNVIIDGIPQEHRPEFAVANFDGKFAWMRSRDEVKPAGPRLYARTVVYLGVPNSMSPADPPELWGDGPIDKLLYGEGGGGDSGGGGGGAQ